MAHNHLELQFQDNLSSELHGHQVPIGGLHASKTLIDINKSISILYVENCEKIFKFQNKSKTKVIHMVLCKLSPVYHSKTPVVEGAVEMVQPL